MAETDLRPFLREQARAAMRELCAIERYFQDPGRESSDEAREAAGAARALGLKLEEGLERAPGPRGRRRTLFLCSRALGRMAEAGRFLVDEASRFGVGEDPALQGLAHEARRSAEELAAAAERLAQASPGAPDASLAARAAGRTEHLRRQATRGLAEEPDVVLTIKLRGLHRRFSEVALHAAEAAELLGELGSPA
ncbi:MAG: hypothetical protein HY554_16070 [Elusimicrobia bacterium]|nr:hypothetical protein [Elusimicrobiota bacterium]